MNDDVMKEGKWAFDDEVAEVFDDMLMRSIPDYVNMRSLVFNIGKRYVNGGTIVDIGCSNGNAIAPFIKRFGDEAEYVLCDVSEPMLQKCKKRFGKVDIRNHDIRNGVPVMNAALILGILTVQFTPIEYRQEILASVYNSLNKGGAFIFVEKVIGNTCEIDQLFVDEYYKMKEKNAYTQEQIANKRKSLEGVLVPITAKWNEEMLHNAGFVKVDCFWRCLNFAGWIAIK